jgi:hypothetical protein
VFQYLLYAGYEKKVNATLDGNAKNSPKFLGVCRCERQTQKAFGNRQSQARNKLRDRNSFARVAGRIRPAWP